MVEAGRALPGRVTRWVLHRGAQTPVGYPMVNVRDIESGKVRATRELFGAD